MRYRRGNKHFGVHFWRIRGVHFPSKDGKDASVSVSYDDHLTIIKLIFPEQKVIQSSVLLVIFP